MRRGKARQAALDWLRQHSYHPRRLTIPWLSTRAYRFAPAPLRNNDKAFYLRAEVEDRKLGGVGIVWIRTWIGWTGTEIGDTEVFWEHMPAEAEGVPTGPTWESAQLVMLDRVAAGERTFRPADNRSAEAGAAFDLEVEHLLALQRRGLIVCGTPVAEVRIPGRAYAYVPDVQLTEEGQRIMSLRQVRRA
jgi:hypothetical protein